ncbi:MAG: RNA polymerase factor sigma-32, partial [Rhodospirillales bacterium]|nr:RNA polymerase factor sigma-32 [Rhodospirillales bacterium]
MASVIPEDGPSPELNLSRYLNRVHNIPMLTPGEEVELARRWVEQGDQSAADRLIT